MRYIWIIFKASEEYNWNNERGFQNMQLKWMRSWTWDVILVPSHSISSLVHLWLPHKGSKSEIKISPWQLSFPGWEITQTFLKNISQVNVLLWPGCPFYGILRPHQRCFIVSLEGNPKSRQLKRKESNWTLGVRLPGRSWQASTATWSKRVTTGFSIRRNRKSSKGTKKIKICSTLN